MVRAGARGRARRSSFRRSSGWLAALGLLAAAILAFVLWPRGTAYAQFVEGGRPTVVFVWSEPTPQNPHV